jgi:hypothetical protein
MQYRGIWDPAPETYRLPTPAVLAPSGKDWVIGEQHVPNLAQYIRINGRGRDYPDNYRVGLGTDDTYGRALTAISLLAREGICIGGIQQENATELPDIWDIGLYRDQRGQLTTCHKDRLSELYR